jgi:hypothetical protein
MYAFIMKMNLEDKMDPRIERKTLNRRTNRLTGGIVLILLGIATLLSNWLNFELYLVLLIGAVLLVWGAFSHSFARIIPGGVLSGIGLGILLLQGPWNLALTEQGRSGVFMLCFALGWLLITALTGLMTSKTLWWPLIPGGVMALTGILLLSASQWFIQYANLIWPVVLIILGLYLVLLWGRSK